MKIQRVALSEILLPTKLCIHASYQIAKYILLLWGSKSMAEQGLEILGPLFLRPLSIRFGGEMGRGWRGRGWGGQSYLRRVRAKSGKRRRGGLSLVEECNFQMNTRIMVYNGRLITAVWGILDFLRIF